jgi:uncharacterized membrane protein YfcA
MHTLDLPHGLLLFFAAVLGGAVNAVAGGGTLLTFPSLLWAGQLARVANATSTVALWPGAASSFWGYRSELGSSRREIAMLSIPSFLGGIAGAVLLVSTSDASFARVVPFLILLATTLFIVQEPLGRWLRRRAAGSALAPADTADSALAPADTADSVALAPAATPAKAAASAAIGIPARGGVVISPPLKPSRARWASVLAIQFAVGVYGGYFGAGIGILMLAAFGLLGLTNIHHMNALKNLNGMCINGIAAVLFVAKGGLVRWDIALLMAAGAIFGGYAGAGTARRIGQKNVRRMIILIGIALTVWLLARQW